MRSGHRMQLLAWLILSVESPLVYTYSDNECDNGKNQSKSYPP